MVWPDCEQRQYTRKTTIKVVISLFFFYRIYENKHESKAKRLKDCVTYTIVIGIFYFRHSFFGGLSRRKDNLWALKARLLILTICSFQSFILHNVVQPRPCCLLVATPYIHLSFARFCLFWSFDSKAEPCRSVGERFFFIARFRKNAKSQKSR